MFAFGGMRIGRNGIVLPDGRVCRQLVEFAGNIHLVRGVGSAEAAGARPAGKRAVRLDLDVVAEAGVVGWIFVLAGNRVGAAACIYQQAGRGAIREDEARDAGTLGHGQLHARTVGQFDRVVARVRLFAVVAGGRGIHREVAAGAAMQFIGGGQHRKIAVERAPCTADMGQAESVELLAVVKIPSIGIRVRAPLDHAEGKGGTGKGVAAAGGPDEGIDLIVGAGLRRGSRGEREGNEQKQEDKPHQRGGNLHGGHP